MRGGFVARLGGAGDTSPVARLLELHTGTPQEVEFGAFRATILVDSEHGPAVDRGLDRLVLAHGAPPAPVDALTRGRGRYAVLETEGRTLRAARDAFGEVPLFYRVVDGVTWLATEVRPLLSVASNEPDLPALSRLVAAVPDGGATGWRDIHRVQPGSIVEFGEAGSTAVTSFWDPRAQLARFRGTRNEALARVRESFITAVERCREPGATLLLSGGFDSSSVAIAPGPGRGGLRAVHVRFSELDHMDESAQARAAARVAGIPIEVLDGSLSRWDPEADLARTGFPLTSLPTGVNEVALAAVGRSGGRTLIDGHDGDGVLGIADAGAGLHLLHGRVRRLARVARRRGARPVARAIVNDFRFGGFRQYVAGFDRYLSGSLRGRVAAEGRWQMPGRRWAEIQVAPLVPPATVANESLEATAAAANIDIRHPFLDREFVELLVSMPFELKADLESTKPLLRNALRAELPPEILHRQGKTDFGEVLKRRVDPALCADVIEATGVSLPEFDLRHLVADVRENPDAVPRQVLVHATRACLMAASA